MNKRLLGLISLIYMNNNKLPKDFRNIGIFFFFFLSFLWFLWKSKSPEEPDKQLSDKNKTIELLEKRIKSLTLKNDKLTKKLNGLEEEEEDFFLDSGKPDKPDRTITNIKARGELLCGVSTGLTGFSEQDRDGIWRGLDVDLGRAVAAAILGDSTKVTFVPLIPKLRFTALQTGKVDMLVRNTTWTLSRDTKINFAGINFYDGQSFMVRKNLGVESALELDGANICVQSNTIAELNLTNYLRANNLECEILNFDTSDEIVEAYNEGRCDAYTTNRSTLASQRTKLSEPDDHMILPEIISKEPLGPVVRHGDDEFYDIVRWSLNIMIESEELDLNSSNVDEIKNGKKSPNPSINRILGIEGNLGIDLGLDNEFGYNIIKQVGNYGESYKINLIDTGILPDRGLNELWIKGGILYTPPTR